MRIIATEQLYTTDFILSDLFCMRQKWARGITFRMDHPRKSNALLYLNGCNGTYNFGGRSLDAPRKSLIYIPQKSQYTCLNRDCGYSAPDAYLVEFNLTVNNETVALSEEPMRIEHFDPYVPELIKKAVSAYESPIRSPASVRAAVYSLLSVLGRGTKNDLEKRFLSIAPGIRLLEEDPFAPYSVETLSAACGISSGCFRRLFRAYSGKSPIEYRTDLKIDMAKNLLSNSSATLELMAELLGFDSASYFCRVFKKRTGVTPSEWRCANR